MPNAGDGVGFSASVDKWNREQAIRDQRNHNEQMERMARENAFRDHQRQQEQTTRDQRDRQDRMHEETRRSLDASNDYMARRHQSMNTSGGGFTFLTVALISWLFSRN